MQIELTLAVAPARSNSSTEPLREQACHVGNATIVKICNEQGIGALQREHDPIAEKWRSPTRDFSLNG